PYPFVTQTLAFFTSCRAAFLNFHQRAHGISVCERARLLRIDPPEVCLPPVMCSGHASPPWPACTFGVGYARVPLAPRIRIPRLSARVRVHPRAAIRRTVRAGLRCGL